MRASLKNIITNPYHPLGVYFDGTNDYLARGAALTGVADGKVGLVSFWFRAIGADATAVNILKIALVGDVTRIGVLKTASDTIQMFGRNAAGTTILTLTTNSAFTSAMKGWAHCAAWWDLATSSGAIYVNSVDDTAAGATLTNDTLDYTTAVTEVTVGASAAGLSKINMELEDLYFNPAETFNLARGGIERFIVGGRPRRLGPSASNPTGSAPAMFFSGPQPTWHTNRGYGGGMTLNGSLTQAIRAI